MFNSGHMPIALARRRTCGIQPSGHYYIVPAGVELYNFKLYGAVASRCVRRRSITRNLLLLNNGEILVVCASLSF